MLNQNKMKHLKNIRFIFVLCLFISSIAAKAQTASGVDGVTINGVSTFDATIKDAVKGRLKIMGLPAEPVGTLLTFWGGTEHGFWAFGMKPQEFASAIKCPVLLQWGKNDPRVSQSEEEILFKNISSTNKKMVIYETAGHESLCKKETEKWKAEIAAFLK